MAKYQVEVIVEIELDGDEQAAFQAVDRIVQRAWDNDNRYAELGSGPAWHFEMLEGCVGEMDP